MRKFWSNLAVQLGKRAGLVSVVGLILTLGLGFGITKLEFATGQDSYLNSGDQIAKDNVAYQDLFGGQIMLVLFTLDEGTTHADLLTGDNRAKIAEAAEKLRANPNIESLVSPIDGLQFTHNLITRNPDTPDQEATEFNPLGSVAAGILLEAGARETDPEAAAVRQEASVATAARLAPFQTPRPDGSPAPIPSTEDPEWIDFLLHDNDGGIRKSLQTFYPDDRHAQMVVRLKGNAPIEVEGAGGVAVQDVWDGVELEGAEILATGAPVILKDINDYLKGGILQLGALAVVIMIAILLIFFDVRWRLLPLAVVLVGVVWAFGLAGYLGVPLSIVTIAGLPVMLGVGIDYAIQMHARIEEEVIIDHAEHPIQETARNLCPALLVVTFDALFAFAALNWAKVPMIRDFALLLCIGVAVICFGSIVIPLATLGIREFKSPTKGRDFREGALGRLVVWLGSLPSKTAIPLMVASVAVFVGGVAVEGKLTLQTDPIQWVNQQSQNRLDVAELERQVDSSSELGVFVTADSRDALFTDENIAWLHGFTAETLAEHPDLLKRASSILTPVSYLTEIEGASDLPPTAEQIRDAYDAAPDAVKRFTVAEDGHALNLLFTTRPSSLDDRAGMVHELREQTDPPESIRVTPSGLAVVGVGLLENLESNRVQLTYLSIFLVFAFLTVRLRSLVRSLLSLVPVLIAVGAASLVAYLFSLKLSPMTAVGGPLVIAVCTEFTSLILLRFIEERGRGLSPQASADVTASRTGRAFIVSAMTAAAGVGVIATSSLPLLRDFGMIVAMNVIVALLSALVILPPLMVWAEERGLVTKGLVDPSLLGNKTRDQAEPNTEDLGGAGPMPSASRR